MYCYCNDCGAYIPTDSDVCLACGKPKRFQSEGDYLMYEGKKIPVYILDIKREAITTTDIGRAEDGMIPAIIVKYIRQFTVIEKESQIKIKF